MAQPPDPNTPPAWWRVAGVLMFVHVGANLGIRIQADSIEHAWWLSNVSHALAAIGLLLASRAILSIALCVTLVPHAIWLTDASIGHLTGTFPAGFTSHTAQFGAVMWFVTSYHVYLLPTLLVALLPGRRFDQKAARWTPALYALLLLYALALPQASNVNYAHAFAPSADWTRGINTMPHALYLAGNFCTVTLLGILPAWCLCSKFKQRSFETPLELAQSHPLRRAA